jgi:altronate hydrolase
VKNKVLKIHPNDNVIVALTDLVKGETVELDGLNYTLQEDIAAKHKFAMVDFVLGSEIKMYDVLVGKANQPILKGGSINIFNVKHAVNTFEVRDNHADWQAPDLSKFEGRTFNGFHRPDGSVGTANYWLVIPLVFCENRNIEVLREALVDDLGYARKHTYQNQTNDLISLYKAGKTIEEILSAELDETSNSTQKQKLFPNVDGVKFLLHDGGCGGTRQDSTALCGMLAGYITHSNCAGATVLSLGCQNAQVAELQAEIAKRDSNFQKPLYILEQQNIGTESEMMAQALKQTFAGLMQANQNVRKPASLDKLIIGLECGGSDGFSGISANPAIGYTSDLVVGLGGTVILAEFPELCGVEQELTDRCVSREDAKLFSHLVRTYSERAEAVGSGFDMNPSPGNIKDGLITDAIKSAGAAKKGGTSPVTSVLDYPSKVIKKGLCLLCTPGNDVESTTAEVASGANLVLFTTGLGTPTGNPIAPVVKIATNTKLFNKMSDIIDLNTGTIIEGEESIEQAGERILDYAIKVASGEIEICAVRNGQDDFIPWKRGVSL